MEITVWFSITFFQPTIIHKIFETNSNFHLKQLMMIPGTGGLVREAFVVCLHYLLSFYLLPRHTPLFSKLNPHGRLP